MEPVKSAIFEIILSPNFSKNLTNFIGPKYQPNENDLKLDHLLSPAQLGVITGLFIILFLNYQTDAKTKIRNNVLTALNIIDVKEFLIILACLLPALLMLPIILSIFLAFKLKKCMIGYKLKHDDSTGFKSFLKGTDVIWAIEESVSKSIINVLAFIPETPESNENVPEQFLASLRERLHSKLMVEKPFPKLFYLRQEHQGYHYWMENNCLTVNDYIRFMKPYANENELMNENEFRKIISNISNDPLPANNKALFEMLVGQKPIQGEDGIKYPVVFRIHHALGDGVALMRLLLEKICDQEKPGFSQENSEVAKLIETLNFPEKFSQIIKKKIDHIFSIHTWIMITHLIKAPSVIIRMALREIDENSIHPRNLCGKKVTNWFFENNDNNEVPLLTLIKLLKRKVHGARFSNILLAALSKSLNDYFSKRNLKVPENMTVVVPARIHNGEDQQQLEVSNRFSVAYQTLPIENPTEFLSEKSLMLNRIEKVRRYSDVLAFAPDYHINYWMMTVVAGLFPENILKKMMESKHSTMAVSNLPGPNFAIKINKFELKNIGFFLPNIGQTACVLSMLSYNNKLQFGMLADENSVGTVEELGEILKGMVDEIKFMAANLLN